MCRRQDGLPNTKIAAAKAHHLIDGRLRGERSYKKIILTSDKAGGFNRRGVGVGQAQEVPLS